MLNLIWNTNQTLRRNVKREKIIGHVKLYLVVTQTEDFCCDLRKEVEKFVENPCKIRTKIIYSFRYFEQIIFYYIVTYEC